MDSQKNEMNLRQTVPPALKQPPIFYCKMLLSLKKAMQPRLAKSEKLLCSVLSSSGDEKNAVAYVLNTQTSDTRVIFTRNLFPVPETLNKKVLAIEPVTNPLIERTSQNDCYRIKAFPSASLKIEQSKLFCKFKELGYVQVAGAVGHVDQSGQPTGITILTLNPGQTPVISQEFFSVDLSIIQSLSVLDKAQIFSQMDR